MRRASLVALAALAAGPLALAAALAAAFAHDGRAHGATVQAATGPDEDAGALPFPLDIRLQFELIDQIGRRVTEADFADRAVALFFGYASCQSICTVALPAMGAAIALLGQDADAIAPLMITVDPARDTPEALARSLPRYHPRMIGLTGSPEALAAVRAAFQVEAAEVARDAAGEPIFAHGSFIYLIGPGGKLRSVLPPILGPERIAELMRRHLLER